MSADKASLVLTNCHVLTMNSSHPQTEALAIKRNRILAVGTSAEVRTLIGPETLVMNLEGKTVLPGFMDSHIHFTDFGQSLTQVNLRDAKNLTEFLDRVKKAASKFPRDKWILGGGWDQDRMEEMRYPTRWDLDKVSPNNPVYLARVCGHACVVNSAALKVAGITKDTPNPPSGTIDKDERTGEPTGILREASAMKMVEDTIPPPTFEDRRAAIQAAMREAFRVGVTSVLEPGVDREIIDAYTKMTRGEDLDIRVNLLVRAHLLEDLEKRRFDHQLLARDHHLQVIGLKILQDGSLGASTAALKQPYSDEPSSRGILMHRQKELNELVQRAHAAGFPVAIHTIGDRACETALNAIEAAQARHPRKRFRDRIDHCQVLNPTLIQRLARLKLIASIQLSFVTSDMYWAEKRLGKRRTRWSYAWRKLIDSGVRCAGGTDCPVEVIDPLIGIQRIVTRQEINGYPPGGWRPEERLTVEEALRLVTLDAAYATSEEDVKGSIEPGKLADLVVLSADPMKVPTSAIKDIKVVMTIIDGKVVYRSEEERGSAA